MGFQAKLSSKSHLLLFCKHEMPTKFRFLLLYGLALGCLLCLMRWANYRLLVIDHATELYGLLIAVVFVGVGIWVGLGWTAPAVVKRTISIPISSPTLPHEPDPNLLNQFGISPRELDVLEHVAKGMTNDEIASQLFVSTNTVKTHLANLYVKLDVKRRTQAVEKARSIGLIS